MQKPSFAESVDEIVKHDGRYDRDAYLFVREGLDYTVKLLKKENAPKPAMRHVSGQQLLEGLRQYALEQFGPMTKTVFTHWGVNRCEDFGEIVFNLVENGVLGKTEQDRREDFRGGYDFEEAFVRPFQPIRRNQPRHSRATNRADRVHRGSGSEKLSSGSN
jgi:uncharacterized repeat protein (TIGR04138 family)